MPAIIMSATSFIAFMPSQARNTAWNEHGCVLYIKNKGKQKNKESSALLISYLISHKRKA